MDKEKQIEEMAVDLCLLDDCKHLPKEECDLTTCVHCMAEILYEKGYRKSSEVAREIFEEIEELLNLQAKIVCKTRADYKETDKPMLSFVAELDGRLYSLRVIEEHIAELKKKYTEGGE